MGKSARDQLAQKLKLLRMIRNWSQEDLAAATGLHRTYISLVERSGCNISLDNLDKLAHAFGLSLPELLGNTDPALVGERVLSALTKRTRRHKA